MDYICKLSCGSYDTHNHYEHYYLNMPFIASIWAIVCIHWVGLVCFCSEPGYHRLCLSGLQLYHILNDRHIGVFCAEVIMSDMFFMSTRKVAFSALRMRSGV
jgi:hypothetical protein